MVAAFAVTTGAEANGLVAGQLCQLVDPLPYIISARNSSLSMAGSDVESDDRLRERIRLAPESFTVAGSVGEYEARTLAVSQDIEEVAVYSPEPGVVDVRFTLVGGELPDAAMIALVKDALSSETVQAAYGHGAGRRAGRGFLRYSRRMVSAPAGCRNAGHRGCCCRKGSGGVCSLAARQARA